MSLSLSLSLFDTQNKVLKRVEWVHWHDQVGKYVCAQNFILCSGARTMRRALAARDTMYISSCCSHFLSAPSKSRSPSSANLQEVLVAVKVKVLSGILEYRVHTSRKPEMVRGSKPVSPDQVPARQKLFRERSMHVLVTTQNRARQDISSAFYACIYRLRMNVYIRAVFYTSFSLRMLLTLSYRRK